jgi:sugar phosphate isomerase/epimerase
MRVVVGESSLALSCCSWCFSCLALEKSIRVIRSLGFEHADVGFAHLVLDGSDPARRQGGRLRKLLGSEGLLVCDLFPVLPYETNDPDARHREHNARLFQRIVEFADASKASGITLKPGMVQPEVSDGGWQASVEALQQWAAFARTAGVRLSVEPHVGSILEDPRSAELMVQSIAGLELTLDYSHFVARGFELDAVERLQRYARHVHVRQARSGKLQAAARQGALPIRRLLEELVARGYRGAISLEYQNSDWQDCNDIDVISETVATLRDLGVEV